MQHNSMLLQEDESLRTPCGKSLETTERGLNSVKHAYRTTSLLLVETSMGNRTMLQRVLSAQGFRVTSVTGMKQAQVVAVQQDFSYAVVNLRLGDDHGLELVRYLRRYQTAMRIVVVTDVDSFASVIVALHAGADDYIPQPVGKDELVDALLDRAPVLPPVPDMPLGLSRACWEHVMRIYEQCDRNVSHTAQRLGMHRRSLQRILGKRAPPLRAST
jgi:two-component system response regulator RegA